MAPSILHPAGDELLDALALRLGWRPTVRVMADVIPKWIWRVLQLVIGPRAIVLGRTLYVGDPSALHDPMRSLRLIAHEGAHWIIGRSLPFYTVYFLQQIVMALSLAAVIGVNVAGYGTGWEWLVPLVLLCLPWPSPNRAELEIEGYAMGIVALRAFGVERQDAILAAVQAVASATYWMTPWPFQRLLSRSYVTMVVRAMSQPRPKLHGWAHDVRDISAVWARADD